MEKNKLRKSINYALTYMYLDQELYILISGVESILSDFPHTTEFTKKDQFGYRGRQGDLDDAWEITAV